MTSWLMTRKKQLNSFHTTTLTKYHFILQTDTNTYHEALNLYRPIIIETYNHRAHTHISLKPIIPITKRCTPQVHPFLLCRTISTMQQVYTINIA